MGVCLSAGGQFGTAATALQRVLELPARPEPWQLAPAAESATTLASIHRQVGRFEEAEQYDAWASEVAGDDREASFSALLGLAADAVGRHDRDLAAQRLELASAACGLGDSWWRQRVRLAWVTAEVRLSWDRAADAVAALRPAVAEAEQFGAPRHVAKSLSFLGVAVHAAGEEGAPEMLGRSALLAESLGAWPLVWATRGLLAEWLAQTDPEQAEQSRRSAEYAVRLIAADLPPALASEWLARPDVAPIIR